MGTAFDVNQRLNSSHPARQTGALTLFTAALILLLMTLMLFYAARVGIFEQRVSANDMHQKLAFHAAEAGIQHATEYFYANSALIASARADVLTDGTDGWFFPGAERWRKCSEYTGDFDSPDNETELAHPCRGESSDARRSASYFYYYDDPDIEGDDPYAINIDSSSFLGDAQQVSVRAVLCVLTLDWESSVPFTGCNDAADPEDSQYMVTFLAHGQSDCNNGVCQGEALISEPASNFSAIGGTPPPVPLTTRTTFPPGGTAEIVTNPNAGGVGVPISVWASNNEACSFGSTEAFGNGDWSTCEAHEWFERDSMPEDMRCPNPSCSCSAAEAISNTVGVNDQLGIDMLWDPDFPCDLFEYFFGIPKTSYLVVKNAAQVVDDCASFDPNSSGLYWVTGPRCDFPTNTQIGTPEHPVAVISAASVTSLNGNNEIWGVLFLTDVEDPAAQLDSSGTNFIYGSGIVDADIDIFAGTLKIIYNEAAIIRAHGAGLLGTLMGGWTDFPKCWMTDAACCPGSSESCPSS
jgi:hypothetical protein